MQSATSDDFEYFQSLDELNLEQSKSTSISAGAEASTSVPNARSVSTRAAAPRRNPLSVEANLRPKASKPKPARRSASLSDEDVCDLLQEPVADPTRRAATASVSTEITSVANPAVARVRVPATAATQIAPSHRPLLGSRVGYQFAPKILAAFIVTGICVCVSWYFISRHSNVEPQSMMGSIRFEGAEPPAAFIRLFKLNSVREEDYIAEILDGKFMFPKVPNGDYALWLATADGIQIPVRPVGASVGFLTEAEHHLRISLTGESRTFNLELSVVKAKK